LRPRRWFFLTALSGGVSLACLIFWAAPIGAFDVSSSPCSLISKSQIEKDLGLAHVKETPVIGNQNPSDGGVVASSCKNIFVWSGSTPTSRQQFSRKLANGTGAFIANIRTFIADPGATNAYQWVDNGFQTMLTGAVLGCHGVMHLSHGHTVALPRYGAQSSTGDAGVGTKGVLTVCGVWDRYDSHRIIVIELEASAHKPTVKAFGKIAKTAVSGFW
jgi:hypothetical protein